MVWASDYQFPARGAIPLADNPATPFFGALSAHRADIHLVLQTCVFDRIIQNLSKLL
jgi:hypothetical protein